MKHFFLLLLLSAGCALAQSQPGPNLPTCTLDASHVFGLYSPTTSCKATAGELSALLGGDFLLLDVSNDPLTAGLKIEIADSGAAAPAGFDELVLDCGNVACGATIFGAGIGGRVGWNLGHPGHDSTGSWWSYNPTATLMELGTSTAGGTVQVYSGDGTAALGIDASQNVTLAADLAAGALFVDSSANRVGIRDTTPDFPLDVEGDGFFRGDLTLQDDSGGGSLTVMMENTGGTTPSTWSFSTNATSGNWMVRDEDTGYNAFQIEKGLSGTAFWYGDAGTPGWGLGTTTPDGLLHVFRASAGSVTASTSADDFVIENSGSGGISILVPDASTAGVYFGSPTSNAGATLTYSQAGGILTIAATGGAADQIDLVVGAQTYSFGGSGGWSVPCVAAAPFVCGGATAGESYCDSSGTSKICFCNGTTFVPNDEKHTGDCT
jgi:hypothetical protein